MDKDTLKALKSIENPERVETVSKYMQAHKEQGSYATGDIFVGIRLPDQRQFVKQFGSSLSQEGILELLVSPIHEYRSIALITLIERFNKTKNHKEKANFVDIYLEYLPYVNHWDLVDLSAPKILGAFLYPNLPEYNILIELAKNSNFWYQRIALVSTLFFIGNSEFEPTFHIVNMLWDQKHVMVQKAIGWMIKEVSKKDRQASICFVQEHLSDIQPLALSIAKEWYPPEIKKSLKSQRKK